MVRPLGGTFDRLVTRGLLFVSIGAFAAWSSGWRPPLPARGWEPTIRRAFSLRPGGTLPITHAPTAIASATPGTTTGAGTVHAGGLTWPAFEPTLARRALPPRRPAPAVAVEPAVAAGPGQPNRPHMLRGGAEDRRRLESDVAGEGEPAGEGESADGVQFRRTRR